jgi:hypothetical protein
MRFEASKRRWSAQSLKDLFAMFLRRKKKRFIKNNFIITIESIGIRVLIAIQLANPDHAPFGISASLSAIDVNLYT